MEVENRMYLTNVTVFALLLGVFEGGEASSVNSRHVEAEIRSEKRRIWKIEDLRREDQNPRVSINSNTQQMLRERVCCALRQKKKKKERMK